MPTTEPQRYDGLSMFLHWSIAIGIVLVAGLELVRGEFPKGSFLREGLKAVHQPAGVVLFGLILARIAWRFTGAKVPPAHGRGLMDFAGHVAHIALYLMMVLLPLLGLVYVFGSDRVIDFGAFKWAMPMKASLGWFARPAREIAIDAVEGDPDAERLRTLRQELQEIGSRLPAKSTEAPDTSPVSATR